MGVLLFLSLLPAWQPLRPQRSSQGQLQNDLMQLSTF